MELTYDPEKRMTNLAKHGIDFADIEGVFYDPLALTREDRDHDELRFVTLGTDGFGRVLVVGYTWRGEDVRVFSARKAQPQERKSYAKGEWHGK
ncbi:MAG: BrnT family toxin [Zoogloeaceae bacterium]|nr:BrnT family toxin [Zoogloeaceae bacterium]